MGSTNSDVTSLKALADIALERLQGHKSNSKPIIAEVFKVDVKPAIIQLASLAEAYEERLSIAEYDGEASTLQAHRMAYLDAFITILTDLSSSETQRDWLAEKIQIALATLEAQNLPTLN